MKPLESMLNIIARKKPRQVFSAHEGRHTVRGIEQEFVLEPSQDASKEQVQVEYSSGILRLPPGRRSLHFISVRTASLKYHLAIRTIQQLCRERKLVSRRQGQGDNSPWLVAEESIRAYCEKQRA